MKNDDFFSESCNNQLEVCIGFSVLVTIALIIALLLSTATMPQTTYKETEYVVQQGDTLWRIASIYCHPCEDKRDWIDDVEEINNITGWIQPGDKLVVKEWVEYDT